MSARGDEWSLSPVARLLLAGRALWFYAGKLAWPHPIVFFYPRWEIDAHVWWQYLFPAAAVLVPVGLWLLRGRIGRGPLAAVLVFAGVLVPALGFFNVYYMRYAYVSDHFQYHASLALVALASAGAATVAARLGRRWSTAAKIVAGTLLVEMAVLTVSQTFIYWDIETLYADVIAKNPDAWMAYGNLASCYESRELYDEALEPSPRGTRASSSRRPEPFPHRPHAPENERPKRIRMVTWSHGQ